jgi:hypothetical protein
MWDGANPSDTSDPITRLRNFSIAVGSRKAGIADVVDMNIWITGTEPGCRFYVYAYLCPFHKAQGSGIHAIAKPRGFRTVIENVAEVGIAVRT